MPTVLLASSTTSTGSAPELNFLAPPNTVVYTLSVRAALPVVDWDAIGRRETITVNDGSGPQTANITTDFSQGAWVNVPINGTATRLNSRHVKITHAVNALKKKIFLSGAAAAPAPPTGLNAS